MGIRLTSCDRTGWNSDLWAVLSTVGGFGEVTRILHSPCNSS